MYNCDKLGTVTQKNVNEIYVKREVSTSTEE